MNQMSSPRDCHSLAVLVEEFLRLFPEVTAKPGCPNGREVNTCVTFDLSPVPKIDLMLVETLADLSIAQDPRVIEVKFTPKSRKMRVSFHNLPAIYDSRASFALAQIMMILTSTPDEDEVGLWPTEEPEGAQIGAGSL